VKFSNKSDHEFFETLVKNFKKLLIWQKGMELVERVYQLTRELPLEERFGLRSQLASAAVSVPANIAEGSARSSAKEYRRFLEISLGSLYELETQVLILDRIKLADTELKQSILTLIDEEQRMVSALIRKLNEA
jgi:four helix bundle protein